jgi:hypothetical protein
MASRIACSSAAIAAACVTLTAPAAAQQRGQLRSAFAISSASGPAQERFALGTTADAAPLLLAPRHSAGVRLGLQFLAAGVGAVGGGIGTFILLRDVSDQRVKGDEGYTRSGNVGYLVGSFAGATIGAHTIGRSLGGRSPLWATSLGALAGSVPLMALGVDEPWLPLYGVVLGWIPQAALAAGGFIMAESR